ncbi:hypothetical protein LC613_24025 [Nostoc sphaeroides CHAB 2801]|uniref:hypothetical protein n=1 Tax=Nostoc sphaeroides TaxID=446679 RepID=UPI001E3BB74D|nr:hypothetical protein [Nostoc sphaeroides]MCC5630894.1 hypothetical protein [Nostoc sphaeroides CHAB 2801]
MANKYLVYMETNLYKQGLLLLRQALDNSTADFRPGQWEAIEELLQERYRAYLLFNALVGEKV